MPIELIGGIAVALIALFGAIVGAVLKAYHELSNDLGERLDKTRERLDKAEAKDDELDALIDVQSKEITRMRHELSAKDTELKRQRDEISDFRRLQDKYEQEVAELRREVGTYQKANEVLKKRNDELYVYISQLRDAIQKLGGTSPEMLKP